MWNLWLKHRSKGTLIQVTPRTALVGLAKGGQQPGGQRSPVQRMTPQSRLDRWWRMSPYPAAWIGKPEPSRKQRRQHRRQWRSSQGEGQEVTSPEPHAVTTRQEVTSPQPHTMTRQEVTSPEPHATTGQEVTSPQPHATTRQEVTSPEPHAMTRQEVMSPEPHSTTEQEVTSPQPHAATRQEVTSP